MTNADVPIVGNQDRSRRVAASDRARTRSSITAFGSLVLAMPVALLATIVLVAADFVPLVFGIPLYGFLGATLSLAILLVDRIVARV